MKRGDLVKIKKKQFHRMDPQTSYWSRVGVLIEVIEDVEPAGDQCVVYWSDNIKSCHWATELEMK